MDQEKIGKFIAKLRKEKKLTQKQLANELGITDRAISKWENGKSMPDLSLLKPICDIFDISINELLSGEHSKNKLEGLHETLSDIHNRKEKTLVYIKFLDEINFIKETRILDKIPFIELSGRTNKRKAIKAFERNVDIMFCTYGVEKFGLDMQLCNNVIYYSQTFDYRSKVQSLDSVSFKGFPSYINIYDFWVKTNLEQIINDSLEHKKNLLSSVNNKLTKIEALQL